MKITDITYDCVQVPFPEEFHPTWYPGKTEQGQVIFVVRVHTDEGITGYANMEAPHGILKLVCATMDYAKEMIIGDSPFDIEKIMFKLRNVARIATRPWVIENACWDIIGKAAGLPVCQLLGACRDRIPVYAAWGEIRSNEQRKEDAGRLVEEGFKAVKIRFTHETIREDIAIVEAVREAVGDKLEIMVDANQGTACERNNNGFPYVWRYEGKWSGWAAHGWRNRSGDIISTGWQS